MASGLTGYGCWLITLHRPYLTRPSARSFSDDRRVRQSVNANNVRRSCELYGYGARRSNKVNGLYFRPGNTPTNGTITGRFQAWGIAI